MHRHWKFNLKQILAKTNLKNIKAISSLRDYLADQRKLNNNEKIPRKVSTLCDLIAWPQVKHHGQIHESSHSVLLNSCTSVSREKCFIVDVIVVDIFTFHLLKTPSTLFSLRQNLNPVAYSTLLILDKDQKVVTQNWEKRYIKWIGSEI